MITKRFVLAASMMVLVTDKPMQGQQSRTSGIGPAKLARRTRMRSRAPKTPLIQWRCREELKLPGLPIAADRRRVTKRLCNCRSAASRNSVIENILGTDTITTQRSA